MCIGGGASGRIADVLIQLNLRRPLIICGPVIIKYGYLERITLPLDHAGLTYGIFSDVPADPTDATVAAASQALQQQDYDCIIGLGGGSPMDTAKMVSLIGPAGGTVRDFAVPQDNASPGLPIIAIPTTAGTGSEATRVSIITDARNDEKLLCLGRAFMPSAALIDYELTLTMPFRLTADTGIDSLTHAIEAYVSRKASQYSDGLALAAMKSLFENIRTACFEPDNVSAREAMMLGSTQAGMAFSNASVALVHGMSRPLGAHFQVPHGLSNAMLLPAVTAFSVPFAMRRYADCARQMGVVPAGTNDTVATRILIEELRRLNEDLKVPSPQQFGIHESDYTTLLPTMAEQALASGSPANNPVVPDIDEIIELYETVFHSSTNVTAPIRSRVAQAL
ncbi:iron-containing alcohol dehydrogenase [Halioglobus japonicus]|nr:iron-containing alcohol dehydrogenase [Halioglobus japonicus]